MQTSLPAPKYLQEEDGLTHEQKAFMSSLPSEKGWLVAPHHQYQGFWYTPKQLQGMLTCQLHFRAHDSDLLLVTTPKSGTTWLKAVMFAIMYRTRYSWAKHPLLTNNPHDLVPFLELKLYADNQVPDFTSFITPRLFATHIPYVSLPKSVKDTNCKVVYLCRNPKDAFISYWHFVNKLRPKTLGPLSLEEASEKFCRGLSLCGPFWDHALGYWKESLESPQRVFFLKFEELKEQPTVHLRRLAEFMGYPFSEEEEKEGVVDEILRLCSFDNLSSLKVNKSGKMTYDGMEHEAFFRQGGVGDWVNYLTSEMVERFDTITEQKFHGSGLKF
ncbi:hypothetical protein HHK36_029884 [Tetracentron sinense]|uniref:Sulfotransferase n=1 Tax=Tetracentron sinense TaxID=13715 RepID=A0A834YEP4_TETSI|nr:hypothetical protein HHK36_029884 [Tetracentron sinense]